MDMNAYIFLTTESPLTQENMGYLFFWKWKMHFLY